MMPSEFYGSKGYSVQQRLCLTFLNLLFCFLLSTSLLGAKPQHALSLGGVPRYPATFSHFDYVNPHAPKGGAVRFGVVGTFDSLNPFVVKGLPAAGLSPLKSHTFASLLTPSHDEPFTRYAYVAETVDLADDHLSVTFTLRKEATFHDGSPITPEDVIFTFQTLLQKGHPLYRSYYKDVKDVVSPGPGKVRFHFRTPDNKELPLVLGEMPLLSQAFFQGRAFEAASLSPLLGSGPYRLKKAEAGRTVTYERVKNWWGENLPVHRGQYNFDTLTYDYYRDFSVAFEAFKSGTYDIRLENVARHWAAGYQNLVAAGKVTKLALETATPAPMRALIFNTRRDLFKDRRVRRALAYAFDFEWLNKNLFYTFYRRTTSYFDASELAAKGLPQGQELDILKPYRNHLPSEVFSTPYTLPKTDGSGRLRAQLMVAQDLLQQAGYQIEKGRLLHSTTKKPFTFDILAPQTPALKRVLMGFLANLKVLGIEARLRSVDTSQYGARLDQFDYDMIMGLLPQSLSPGSEQRSFWQSVQASIPGSHNYAGIQDPIIDALIEKVIQADTRETLVAATRALDRVLLWGHYTIPLYHNPKTPIAVWRSIAFPETFPKYHISFDTWWSREAEKKAVREK